LGTPIYRLAAVGANGPQAPLRALSVTQAFIAGMRDLGYVEGEDIEYVLRSTEGKIAERTPPMMAEFKTIGVDVIVTAAQGRQGNWSRTTRSRARTGQIRCPAGELQIALVGVR
jgi:hypothetical protein